VKYNLQKALNGRKPNQGFLTLTKLKNKFKEFEIALVLFFRLGYKSKTFQTKLLTKYDLLRTKLLYNDLKI
jgi:hypothetical protein